MHEINKNRTLRYRAERFRGQNPKKSPIEITHIDGKPIAKASGSRSLSAWLRRLPRPQDPTQKKALRNLAVFFILMLLLTIIARGTASASLAAVTTTKSSAGDISESVRGTGKVSADGYLYMEAPEELTVRELLAAAGAALKAGDPVLRFDPEEVQQKLDRKNIELKEKQLQLEKLLQETPTDDSTLRGAEQSLQWAEQDYADAKTKGDKQIAAAKQAVTDAKAELQRAQRYLEELKNQPAATPAPSEESGVSQPETEDNGGLLRQAEAAVNTAAANVDSAETALKDTEGAVETELKTAARAIETAKQSLESARTTGATQSQEKENQQKQNSIEAETARLDIEKLKAAVTQLETLKANEGILKTEKEGLVEKLPAIGDRTAQGEALVTLADTSGGFEAELSISRSDAKKLSVGGKAEVVKQTGYMYGSSLYEGTILSISEPDESDMVKVKVSLPEGDFKLGDSLDVRLTSSSSSYDCCLPLAAIRSDSNGYFILVVDKRQTVLGSEEVLRKVPVTVRSTGDDSAAVEGAFSPDDKVVQTSTKPVAEGDRVRVES